MCSSDLELGSEAVRRPQLVLDLERVLHRLQSPPSAADRLATGLKMCGTRIKETAVPSRCSSFLA